MECGDVCEGWTAASWQAECVRMGLACAMGHPGRSRYFRVWAWALYWSHLWNKSWMTLQRPSRIKTWG